MSIPFDWTHPIHASVSNPAGCPRDASMLLPSFSRLNQQFKMVILLICVVLVDGMKYSAQGTAL